MIVSVVNTKGGVGKSTLGFNLAVARALAGKDVWLINGDKQRTALQAVAQRISSGRQPVIQAAHYSNGAMLRAQVEAQSKKFDDVVIESGGRDNTSMRASIMVADKVIIPLIPRNPELWAMDELWAVLNEAIELRPSIECYAVLNMGKPTGKANAAALEYVASSFPAIKIMAAQIMKRDLIDDCFGEGMSVIEYPKAHKAKDEMTAFANEVFNSK